MKQELIDLIEITKEINNPKLTEKTCEVLMACHGTKLLKKSFDLQSLLDSLQCLKQIEKD